jgi:hypothetical protein
MNPLTYLPARFRAAYYAAYTIVGLVLGGISVYDASINAAQPAWLVGSLAVFGYVGIATGATALSNVGKAPDTMPFTGSHGVRDARGRYMKRTNKEG